MLVAACGRVIERDGRHRPSKLAGNRRTIFYRFQPSDPASHTMYLILQVTTILHFSIFADLYYYNHKFRMVG